MKFLRLACFLIPLVAAPAASAAVSSSSRTAMILLRALVYDRKLPERSGGDVHVLVAHSGQGACAPEMVAAFEGLASTSVKGMPLKVTSHAYVDAAALDATIAADGVDAVFLCDGVDAAAVAPVLVQRRVVGMAASRAAVVSGLTLGAVVDDAGSARVIVNLPASRSAGVEFAADLFSVAEVIR